MTGMFTLEKGMLKLALPQTYNKFSRAVVMPNLSNPITTVKDVIEYKKIIENEFLIQINFFH